MKIIRFDLVYPVETMCLKLEKVKYNFVLDTNMYDFFI